jgi:serine/threonine-protein kinase
VGSTDGNEETVAGTVAPGARRGAEVAAEFTFSKGQVLGDRYRVLKRLGRGGMGEVWRAYDLKLRMDVALKTLLMTVGGGEEGLELLRGEVRAAREVISPNVCRLFDIIEIDGQELVSMEYIDGQTLLDLLDERCPLEIQEAGEIGSQFLAGLEAIHQAGLVHRDIKPENIMLTRSGRVVIMDFGLTARSGTGVLAGTPAYMPPEQGRGEATDARADVFSAGMVLSEMLSAERGPEASSKQTFWENVRKKPPVLPESPWSRILVKAVAADPEERYDSAAQLARKLEEIAVRVEGAEDKTPYPGLESFGEDNAEFFFGREAEVEALWKKLQQSSMLGL